LLPLAGRGADCGPPPLPPQPDLPAPPDGRRPPRDRGAALRRLQLPHPLRRISVRVGGYSVFLWTSSLTSSTTLSTVCPATSVACTPLARSVARITAVATAAAIRIRATIAR